MRPGSIGIFGSNIPIIVHRVDSMSDDIVEISIWWGRRGDPERTYAFIREIEVIGHLEDFEIDIEQL